VWRQLSFAAWGETETGGARSHQWPPQPGQSRLVPPDSLHVMPAQCAQLGAWRPTPTISSNCSSRALLKRLGQRLVDAITHSAGLWTGSAALESTSRRGLGGRGSRCCTFRRCAGTARGHDRMMSTYSLRRSCWPSSGLGRGAGIDFRLLVNHGRIAYLATFTVGKTVGKPKSLAVRALATM
jgi:hypothetical protein